MTHKIDGGVPIARPSEATSRPLPAVRAGAERGAPVAATESVRLTGEAEGLQALERELGAGPAGIDVARVNALRAAISDGSYRVDAQAVASRMLDLEHQLGG
ncbi:flagellar biosynthesis anti-sigma factor FlgM [Luteimonas sp. SDU101]|uniref:flagellar biosynthesis anti-sigma factor FlgM n=1 Tax=unclassified Luteimonas TaxID=2629088 RepID=UPI003EC0722B